MLVAGDALNEVALDRFVLVAFDLLQLVALDDEMAVLADPLAAIFFDADVEVFLTVNENLFGTLFIVEAKFVEAAAAGIAESFESGFALIVG